MTTRVNAVLISVALLAFTTGLAGCGHYTCQTGFGDTSCGSSGSPTLSQSGGTSTASAFVYAVDQGQTGATSGTIDGYQLNSSSTSFGPITTYTAPTIPAADGGIGMAVAQKQFLYAGFAGSLEIFGWTISSSGNLTSISGSPFPATFLNGTPAGGPDTMITDPAGTNLFIADTLGNAIYVYQVGSGGVLTTGTGSPVSLPSGFLPINMTTDGLGKYLYVTDGDASAHTGTSVAAYSIGTGGALTAVPGSPWAFPMWQVKGEPTGKFLIGTSGKTVPYAGVDDKNLYIFSIGSGTGALTQATTQSTVNAPFNIAVQSNSGGSQVYSFGINDTQTAFNPIEGYTISGTGTLSADSGSPFSGIGDGSWGQLDESGNLLFVYGSFIDPSTNQITTEIAPIAVGSGGALTQPITTLTITTPGFWTVTDGQ